MRQPVCSWRKQLGGRQQGVTAACAAFTLHGDAYAIEFTLLWVSIGCAGLGAAPDVYECTVLRPARRMHGMGLSSHMQRALNCRFLRTPGRQLASLQNVCVSSRPIFCSVVLLLLLLLLLPAGSGEQALAGADVGVCL